MTRISADREGLIYSEIVHSLYAGILGRPADGGGFEGYVNALRSGMPLADVIRSMLDSEEYKSHALANVITPIVLPDLTKIFPEKYEIGSGGEPIFNAASDDDFRLMESLIARHRYYDSFGVWSPKIDFDKQVTAAIVKGLGARNCIELGCFNGPVLSLLAERGIDVCGVEVSHLAFLLAFPNIHQDIRYGDLLSVEFDDTFDLFLGMDILEHLSPLDLDRYIERIAELVSQRGFAYINSPMFGSDDIFGTVFDAYLPQWKQAGDNDFWRHIHCDALGWPKHGHLVWASPKWWEKAFLRHGLVRDRIVESTLQSLLASFFKNVAPARRSFFVLRHSQFRPDTVAIADNLAREISPLMDAIAERENGAQRHNVKR